MVKLYFQQHMEYEIDTETNEVKILRKWNTPMKGTQKQIKKKPKPVKKPKKIVTTLTTQNNGEVYL